MQQQGASAGRQAASKGNAAAKKKSATTSQRRKKSSHKKPEAKKVSRVLSTRSRARKPTNKKSRSTGESFDRKFSFAKFPQLANIEQLFGLPDVPARNVATKPKKSSRQVKKSRDGKTKITREQTRENGEDRKVTTIEPRTKPGTKGYQPPRYRSSVIRDAKSNEGSTSLDLISKYDAGGFSSRPGEQQAWIGFVAGKSSGTMTRLVAAILPLQPKKGDQVELLLTRKSGGQLALEIGHNGRVYTFDVVRQSQSMLFRMSTPPPPSTESWAAPEPVTNK